MPFTDPHSFCDLEQGRIKHIDFTLDIDFSSRMIRGTAQYTMDKPVKGSLYMDTRDLQVNRIFAGEKSLEWELDTTDNIIGQRLHIKNIDDRAQFCIHFSTSPASSALQWLAPEQTAGRQHPYLFSQCQSIHARSVFPCQDSPSVRFTYQAEAKVPRPLTAVMSAERTEISAKGDHHICRFRMPQAIPAYLFALAVGNITFKDLGKRSRIYAEPEVVESAAWEFADTEKMMEEAEKLFGPYIWDRFDMLVMPPSFPYGGMENPRLTFLTPTLIVGDRSMVNVVTHELAHSWTGNLVTNATWEDFWLNEGWTVYAERRILEVLESEDAAELQAAIRRNLMYQDMNLMGMDADATKLKFSQKGIDFDSVYSHVFYEKGFAFITMLEKAVGRKTFDEFIRRYIETFPFQSLTSEEFVAFVEKEIPEAKRKVNIQEWLYGAGFPADAPQFRSTLLDDVNLKVDAYKSGKKPGKDEVRKWNPQQVELFLQSLPRPIPVEDCRYFEDLFRLKESRNKTHLTEFYVISITSGYQEALAGIEAIISTVGRMLYLKPLYRALVQTEWSKSKGRGLFERYRKAYHPIADMVLDRILKEAGV